MARRHRSRVRYKIRTDDLRRVPAARGVAT